MFGAITSVDIGDKLIGVVVAAPPDDLRAMSRSALVFNDREVVHMKKIVIASVVCAVFALGACRQEVATYQPLKLGAQPASVEPSPQK